MAGEKVFISYARADHEDEGRASECFVQKLYRALEAAGFVPWLDHHDLPSRGSPFPAELAKAVEQSDRFIAVCGPAYPSSDWARAERDHAQLHCIAMTPVLFKGDYKTCLPAEIANLNAIDMRGDFGACWPALLKRLREETAKPGPLRGDPIPLPPSHPLPRMALIEQIRMTIRPEDSLPVVLSGRQAVSAVHAPFGLGKTTLAAMTALDCAVRRGFPDGVVWISVGQEASAEGLRSKIGAAFGLSAEQMREAAALTALLQDKDACSSSTTCGITASLKSASCPGRACATSSPPDCRASPPTSGYRRPTASSWITSRRRRVPNSSPAGWSWTPPPIIPTRRCMWRSPARWAGTRRPSPSPPPNWTPTATARTSRCGCCNA